MQRTLQMFARFLAGNCEPKLMRQIRLFRRGVAKKLVEENPVL